MAHLEAERERIHTHGIHTHAAYTPASLLRLKAAGSEHSDASSLWDMIRHALCLKCPRHKRGAYHPGNTHTTNHIWSHSGFSLLFLSLPSSSLFTVRSVLSQFFFSCIGFPLRLWLYSFRPIIFFFSHILISPNEKPLTGIMNRLLHCRCRRTKADLKSISVFFWDQVII